MKKRFFYAAVAGFILGLIVHLAAVSGYDLSRDIPFVWILHVGVFIVFVPGIIYMRQNKAYQQLAAEKQWRSGGVKQQFQVLFGGTPLWLRLTMVMMFVYAIVNFLLFMMSQHGVPDIREGEYILHNHGEIIRTITEEEYYHYRANELRGFSGHWLLFYSVSMGLLYPFDETENNY